MDVNAVLGIVGASATAVSAITGYVITIVKSRKAMKLEQEAKLKAEKEKFYLTTAANLVVSAEKLNLTGPQKKEYVMTWLENEATKAGVEVDKPLMSVAIERTILIMNDYKDKDAAVSDLLTEELDESVEREKIRLASEIDTMNKNLDATKTSIKDGIKLATNQTKTALEKAKEILNK